MSKQPHNSFSLFTLHGNAWKSWIPKLPRGIGSVRATDFDTEVIYCKLM